MLVVCNKLKYAGMGAFYLERVRTGVEKKKVYKSYKVPGQNLQTLQGWTPNSYGLARLCVWGFSVKRQNKMCLLVASGGQKLRWPMVQKRKKTTREMRLEFGSQPCAVTSDITVQCKTSQEPLTKA